MNNWDIKKVCTFTGHRPERLEIPEKHVIEWLAKQIRQASDEGYTDFITGMQNIPVRLERHLNTALCTDRFLSIRLR